MWKDNGLLKWWQCKSSSDMLRCKNNPGVCQVGWKNLNCLQVSSSGYILKNRIGRRLSWGHLWKNVKKWLSWERAELEKGWAGGNPGLTPELALHPSYPKLASHGGLGSFSTPPFWVSGPPLFCTGFFQKHFKKSPPKPPRFKNLQFPVLFRGGPETQSWGHWNSRQPHIASDLSLHGSAATCWADPYTWHYIATFYTITWLRRICKKAEMTPKWRDFRGGCVAIYMNTISHFGDPWWSPHGFLHFFANPRSY